jgi:hypothetical protein
VFRLFTSDDIFVVVGSPMRLGVGCGEKGGVVAYLRKILFHLQRLRLWVRHLNAIIFLIWAISTKIQEKSQHQRFLPNESIVSFSLIS